MFEQFRSDRAPERVENDTHALSSREFRCRNEVGVARDEDNRIRLSFERDRRDVDPDPHIHRFLAKAESEIVIFKFADRKFAFQ